MRKKMEARWQKLLLIIMMFVVSMAMVGVSAYLYSKSFRDIFILLLVMAACFGASIFSFFQSDIFHTLHYDNGDHFIRFVDTFLMGVAACCLLPISPEDAWAVPSLALALSLFSNMVTGVIAYAGLLCLCVYFAGADMLVFLLYFLVGVVFAVLFDQLDEDYKTGGPMSGALILYVTIMIAKTVFQSHGMLAIDIFVLPFINIFITFAVMLVVLRFYCAAVIDKEKGGYLLINDQEFSLLAKYKEEDKQIYYNALHTAYFAEKTARILHMDVDVAKNGGYYHRIIVAECRKQNRTLEDVCKDYKFPPEAVKLLQEYNYRSQTMKMRETVAVFLADAVVSSILYLIGKGQDGELDYGKLATAVIRRKIDSGILNDSDISLADLGGIEKIYAGEKLYYDFLRRE